MSTPLLVSLAELKTYLGITGTSDDLLLASIASNASAQAERDTSRYFAVRSNHTERYSTNGQHSLRIYDVPYTDASRTITWLSAPLTQDTNVWLLPDETNSEVSTTIQIQHFDPTRGEWYKSNPFWFDAGLDLPNRSGSSPNDLVVTGVHGHPETPPDVKQAVTELAVWLYYRAKSGASGQVILPSGGTVELTDYPPVYREFVRRWGVNTGVAVI